MPQGRDRDPRREAPRRCPTGGIPVCPCVLLTLSQKWGGWSRAFKSRAEPSAPPLYWGPPRQKSARGPPEAAGPVDITGAREGWPPHPQDTQSEHGARAAESACHTCLCGLDKLPTAG